MRPLDDAEIVAAITGRTTVLTAPLTFTASEVLIGAAAIGVYRRSRWPSPVLLAHAVAWTAFAALFTLFFQPGFFGLLSLLVKSKALEGDVSAFSAKLLFAAVWERVAWSWVIAIMVRRLMLPGINAAAPVVATKEQRALVGGVGLVAAYALLSPWLSGLVRPIRQIDANIFQSDREHVQLVLSVTEHRALSPEQAREVDELNEDLRRLLSGQAPQHLKTPEIKQVSTWYFTRSDQYRFVFNPSVESARQVDVSFFAKGAPRFHKMQVFHLR